MPPKRGKKRHHKEIDQIDNFFKNPDNSINLLTGQPCKKAAALLDIIKKQGQLEELDKLINEREEELKELIKTSKESHSQIATQRLAFCQSYPTAGATLEKSMDQCMQLEKTWKKALQSKFWWATSGLLVSLNDMPDALMEEILSFVGTIEQARLRSVCRRWNGLILSWDLRKNLLIILDDLPGVKLLSRAWIGNKREFDFRVMARQLRPLITPATNSVILCNRRNGPISFKNCTKHPSLVNLPYSFADMIRPMLRSHSAAVREMIFADFHMCCPCWTGSLTIMHGAWILDGQAPIGRCTFVRCRAFELYSDRLVAYCESKLPFLVLEDLPEPLVIYGQTDDDVERELIPYLPKQALPLADLGKVIMFCTSEEQENRGYIWEILRHWEERFNNTTDIDLKSVEWSSLKGVTLFEMQEMMPDYEKE